MKKLGAYFVGLTLIHFWCYSKTWTKDPTFGNTSIIALEFLNYRYEFDKGFITFNQFKSVISHKTVDKPIFALSTTVLAGSMSVYDDINADVLQNYQEYSLANIIYYSPKEFTTSEQRARMKASDMIDKVTLTHSQAHQAITRGDWDSFWGHCCGWMKIKLQPYTRCKEEKKSWFWMIAAFVRNLIRWIIKTARCL